MSPETMLAVVELLALAVPVIVGLAVDDWWQRRAARRKAAAEHGPAGQP